MVEAAVRAAGLLASHRETTDADRAKWVGYSEHFRAYPEDLAQLKADHEPVYDRFVSGLRILEIEARSEEWRDPSPLIGGRPEQLIPGTPGSFSDRTDWRTWLLVGGRGSGKSRTGAEAIRELLFGRRWAQNPRVALVGRTMDAVRTEMIENTLLQVIPEGSIIKWRTSTVELWVDIGHGRIAHIKGYSAEKPDRLRGPNLHLAWADEMASWADAKRSPAATDTTWSNMNLAVRLTDGAEWRPRIIATTTPKAVSLIRNQDPDDWANPGQGLYDDPFSVVSNMSTLDNLDNLAPHFYETAIKPLTGTRLYDQEVLGELMDEAIGAQWSGELIAQMTHEPTWPEGQAGGLRSIVIGVDPSVGAGTGDECGIIVSGLAADGRAYVLADLSGQMSPAKWSKVIARAFIKWGASAVIVETNNGAALVAETLGRYAPNLPLKEVWAKASKMARAEPVALLSDQDRVRLAGRFSKLTYQLRTWEGDGPSPDRLDAFVYSILYLLPPFGLDSLVSWKSPSLSR
jgi:phage terminase large subunit-like protein